MATKAELEALFDEEFDLNLKEYFEFLKFQSISSEEAYQPEVLKCANWLKAKIEALGFKVETWPTVEHPVLFASFSSQTPNANTILLYNHYDVQPVDPLELWKTPPFEPQLIDGEVYARGAQDNKGQLFYVYLALKALLKLNHTLPLNVKWIIEGGEECGSKGLSKILHEKKAPLKSDYLTIVDVGLPASDAPSVTLGTRGLVTLDMSVTGSSTDLHSGMHGGIVYNPLHAIVEILAGLRNPDGSINVPGFYDSIQEIDRSELKEIDLDFDVDKYKNDFDTYPTGGERRFSPRVRNWLRPTLEINGLHGGYGGSGFKTVIPAKAEAKISCRLIAGQEPIVIGEQVKKKILELAPEGVKVEVHVHSGGGVAAKGSAESAPVKAFVNAFSEVFEKDCKFIYEGASIPVVTELAKVTGGELVLVGLGLATDNIHAPNEHFGVERLKKGMSIIALGLQNLA